MSAVCIQTVFSLADSEFVFLLPRVPLTVLIALPLGLIYVTLSSSSFVVSFNDIFLLAVALSIVHFVAELEPHRSRCSEGVLLMSSPSHCIGFFITHSLNSLTTVSVVSITGLMMETRSV
jgi:hypothetical protein